MIQALENLADPEKSSVLTEATAGFLERYGSPGLMGREWEKKMKGTEPEQRFQTLIKICGFDSQPHEFFSALFDWVKNRAVKGQPKPVVLNGFELPGLLVYHILETAAPGQALFSLKRTDQLEKRTGRTWSPSLQRVLDTYPVRLSSHVIRQSLVSQHVAVQYLPFEKEQDPTGHELTFDGHFKQGLMEQMYRNRAIFLLDMRCPVYCRFCFRKHKSLRKEKSPGRADVGAAVLRVGQNPEIKEILITGGEPLLNRENLEAAIQGLMRVEHVKNLRIATRSLVYYPHLFLHHKKELIRYLESVRDQCLSHGKRLEIGVHIVHPDELSVQSLEIISLFTAGGIPVYVQTPFLKGVNHEGPVLGKLFTQLRSVGAQIYYIFTPCHPIHGTLTYWSPISLSLEAYAWLRANLSDRSIPKLCTATPLGKMEWHTSGWAVDKDETDSDHIWIRTPYTAEYFTPMLGKERLPVQTRENKDKTLDVKCLIDMGDKRLFLGDKGPFTQLDEKSSDLPEERFRKVKEIQDLFYSPNPIMKPLEDTGIPNLTRVHRTRANLTLGREMTISRDALAYLRKARDVTDIVMRIPRAGHVDDHLEGIQIWIDQIRGGIDRYLCIRLQWPMVQTDPQRITQKHILGLRALSGFDIAHPLKIEIETWWLKGEQITPCHESLFSGFVQNGIQVYANCALIQGVNDDPEIIEVLAHRVRDAGMEFHQVYTQGLEIQKRVNRAGTVTRSRVGAIASRIRKNCTGREIPLYVGYTSDGEIDFTLLEQSSGMG